MNIIITVYVICLFFILLVSSIGIDIYHYLENRNKEDIEKDIFAYGWFIGMIVLSIIMSVACIVVYYFIRDVHWSWSLILSILSIISSSLGWDLVSRTKKLQKSDEVVWDRRLFIGITCASFILFFITIQNAVI